MYHRLANCAATTTRITPYLRATYAIWGQLTLSNVGLAFACVSHNSPELIDGDHQRVSPTSLAPEPQIPDVPLPRKSSRCPFELPTQPSMAGRQRLQRFPGSLERAWSLFYPSTKTWSYSAEWCCQESKSVTFPAPDLPNKPRPETFQNQQSSLSAEHLKRHRAEE